MLRTRETKWTSERLSVLRNVPWADRKAPACAASVPKDPERCLRFASTYLNFNGATRHCSDTGNLKLALASLTVIATARLGILPGRRRHRGSRSEPGHRSWCMGQAERRSSATCKNIVDRELRPLTDSVCTAPAKATCSARGMTSSELDRRHSLTLHVSVSIMQTMHISRSRSRGSEASVDVLQHFVTYFARCCTSRHGLKMVRFGKTSRQPT